ncbi:hypothetical protein FQR65_LT17205 [Abscondita terminalis]|nr:hypothetical protein FQR65_LT17205 [Abscondita terminalis]
MWFGEISLVDQQPRSHDAIAVAQHPQYWFHIAQLTSQKLRFAFLELISIQTQHIQQRMAQRLMFILNGYGNHAYIEKNTIHLSQDQLALMLKCSRQTINQELHLLEQQALLLLHALKVQHESWNGPNHKGGKCVAANPAAQTASKASTTATKAKADTTKAVEAKPKDAKAAVKTETAATKAKAETATKVKTDAAAKAKADTAAKAATTKDKAVKTASTNPLKP